MDRIFIDIQNIVRQNIQYIDIIYRLQIDRIYRQKTDLSIDLLRYPVQEVEDPGCRHKGVVHVAGEGEAVADHGGAANNGVLDLEDVLEDHLAVADEDTAVVHGDAVGEEGDGLPGWVLGGEFKNVPKML